MKFIMATEAQRLISISLAKIAASRCVRGGVSLHKNLLVATVLQKARYIFMEEAFHTLHGHYINQANSKFIQQLRYQEQLENQLRQQHDKDFDDEDDESTLDDSELDLFSSPMDTNESLNFLNHDSQQENNKASTSSDHLIYLDLDVNRMKSNHHDQHSSIISGQKRRSSSSDEYDSEDSLLSIFPIKKQMKFSNSSSSSSDDDEEMRCENINTNNNNNISSSNSNNSNDISTDNCLSLDFLSNDLHLTSDDHQNCDHERHAVKINSTTTATANVTMAPLDMSSTSNTSAISSSSSSTTTTTTTPSSSSIDRITSLVSIFNFGNLQRSVSTPDLCSSSSNHTTVENSCCNLQRQIAMTV